MRADGDALRPIRVGTAKVGAEVILSRGETAEEKLTGCVSVCGVRMLSVGGLNRHGGARDGVAVRIDYGSFQGADRRSCARPTRQASDQKDGEN